MNFLTILATYHGYNMSAQNSLVDLALIKRKIRWGHQPENPSLIKTWLKLEEQHIVDLPTTELKRHQYEAQFHLLVNTIEDALISNIWRQICLDNIYQPLHSLHKLTDCNESVHRLKTLSNKVAFISVDNIFD